jgi:hypothetical protein
MIWGAKEPDTVVTQMKSPARATIEAASPTRAARSLESGPRLSEAPPVRSEGTNWRAGTRMIVAASAPMPPNPESTSSSVSESKLLVTEGRVASRRFEYGAGDSAIASEQR